MTWKSPWNTNRTSRTRVGLNEATVEKVERSR